MCPVEDTWPKTGLIPGILAGVRLALGVGMTGMMRQRTSTATAAVLAAVLVAGAASAQTKIEPPKNSYSPQQDVELGREAAAEVRSTLPMLDDGRTEDYIEGIGQRLIREIPSSLRQPAFRYSFDVANLRDINAFALPGGPMFLNRGMIQAARSEGEVAGVMAHELAHVVLRHGTAQATKGQKFAVGAIAGQILGAIVGGRTGSVIAQGSEIGLGTWFLKYGREYERQADLLGAQIMARAGYDPRQMASMFETIERQGGNRGPEWLSSHPNPGNRVQAINREAEMLRVERSTASGNHPSIRARLNQMPQAPTTQEAARRQANGGRNGGSVGTSGRTARVDPPSSQWRTYQPGDFMRLQVPANWREMGGGSGTVTYAPDGGYDNGSFTHGLQVGVARGDGGSLQDQTERLIQGFAQSNPNLRRQNGYSRTSVDGRQGLTTTLSNVSDATGARETVNLTTVQLEDGALLFLVGVAPASEARAYLNTFGRVRESVELRSR
jgi:beta-barrel assembly-enhancing protease